MKRRIKQLMVMGLFVLSVCGLSFGTIKPASAAAPLGQFAACSGTSSFFGFSSWDACLPKENGRPVIKSLDDVWKIAFPIIETMIKATGYIAVTLIIWGGIKYITSQGEPKAITSAQQTIQNSIIGLIIAILSVAMVRFIADRF